MPNLKIIEPNAPTPDNKRGIYSKRKSSAEEKRRHVKHTTDNYLELISSPERPRILNVYGRDRLECPL